MKKIKQILVMLIGISVIGMGLSYAQQIIPKKSIPTNISSDVKKNIEMLYSSDAVKRAEGAVQLGQIGDRAISATPYLIEILKDTARIKRTMDRYDQSGRVVSFYTNITTIGSIVAETLKKITGEDLGDDQTKWLEWWEKNKTK